MRRLFAIVGVIAALTLVSAAPAVAQEPPAATVQCSEVFGPDVEGVIVFTRGGTPSVFTCRGGIFGNPPRDFEPNIPCSDLFGPDVTGRIVFTRGLVSVFTCQGGPFG